MKTCAGRRTSLVAWWLRLCASTAGDVGLIPGPGTKILHELRSCVPLGTTKKKKKDLLCKRGGKGGKGQGVPVSLLGKHTKKREGPSQTTPWDPLLQNQEVPPCMHSRGSEQTAVSHGGCPPYPNGALGSAYKTACNHEPCCVPQMPWPRGLQCSEVLPLPHLTGSPPKK